jgi:hypothetical protein
MNNRNDVFRAGEEYFLLHDDGGFATRSASGAPHPLGNP